MFSDIYRNSTEKNGKYVKELSPSFPKLKKELKNSLLVRFLLLFLFSPIVEK